MNGDINAKMQMKDNFVDDEERRQWDDKQREISDITHSFSGHERNRLFLSDAARQFVDVSALSNVDSPADGRAFVTLDYDRDGYQDMVVVNSNRPLCSIYRNSMEPAASRQRHAVIIRLVGGNRQPQPSTDFSARDGFGAKIRVRAGELKLLREHLCGEGLAGQNSATKIIGTGSASQIDVDVEWPSGRRQQLRQVPAGMLVTVYENHAEAGNEQGFTIEPYQPVNLPVRSRDSLSPDDQPDSGAGNANSLTNRDVRLPPAILALLDQVSPADGVALRDQVVPPENRAASTLPQLVVCTTMASWCTACVQHQPDLRYLRSAFDDSTVRVVGVPIDPSDTPERLAGFVKRNGVDYPVLTRITTEDRQAFDDLLTQSLETSALPSTVVARGDGRVLMCLPGIPHRLRLAPAAESSLVVRRRTPANDRNTGYCLCWEVRRIADRSSLNAHVVVAFFAEFELHVGDPHECPIVCGELEQDEPTAEVLSEDITDQRDLLKSQIVVQRLPPSTSINASRRICFSCRPDFIAGAEKTSKNLSPDGWTAHQTVDFGVSYVCPIVCNDNRRTGWHGDVFCFVWC